MHALEYPIGQETEQLICVALYIADKGCQEYNKQVIMATITICVHTII